MFSAVFWFIFNISFSSALRQFGSQASPLINFNATLLGCITFLNKKQWACYIYLVYYKTTSTILMAAQIFWENPCSHSSQTAGLCVLVILHHVGQHSPQLSEAGDHRNQSKILHSSAERCPFGKKYSNKVYKHNKNWNGAGAREQ